ncbi:MAG: BON domain-containing protein [SAR324 cluster bacterium]|nr:BON domain-containing protein [SAR324 cluster bacterium]
MKHYRQLLFVLLCTSFLGGCALALVGGGAAVGGYYVGKDERSAKRIATDTAITAKINAEYIADENVKTFKIGVKTYRGVVTLTGKVPNQQMIDRAIRIAEDMEGVNEVNSLLTVEQ